jgi:DnaJ-class molecular chaperone
MAHRCPHCDYEIELSDGFCSNCGASLRSKNPRDGVLVNCAQCNGTGKVAGTFGWDTCPACHGAGKQRV